VSTAHSLGGKICRLRFMDYTRRLLAVSRRRLCEAFFEYVGRRSICASRNFYGVMVCYVLCFIFQLVREVSYRREAPCSYRREAPCDQGLHLVSSHPTFRVSDPSSSVMCTVGASQNRRRPWMKSRSRACLPATVSASGW
jgi:hypothetical protein